MAATTATKKKVVKKTVTKTTRAAKHPGKKGGGGGKGGTKKKGKATNNGQLRKPQLRILNCLASGKALTRIQISKSAPVDNAMCTTYIGSNNPEVRDRCDKTTISLLTRKYVKVEQHDVNGKDVVVYSITALGKKSLGAAKK